MGRHLDRLALWAMLAIGLYLFFLGAWDSIPLACGAAFACCALVRRFLRDHPIPRRVSGSQTAVRLMHLAELTDEEAQAKLSGMIARRFPDEHFRLAPVLKHPEASLTSGDILNAWKANRGAGRLVIAATCPCESRAALYARELRDPIVAVMDSRGISKLLRAQKQRADDPPLSTPTLRQRSRALLARFAWARVTPRNALLPLAMLIVYLRGGNPLYLFAALAMLLHIGVALAQHRTRRRLFEGE